jgi:hypothetical protein
VTDFFERRELAAPRWLKAILAATLVFNLLDLVLTMIVVLAGVATEANPVMAYFLDAGTVPFALVKLTLVSVGVLMMWRERHRPLAVWGSVFVFCVYSLVMLCHVPSVEYIVSVVA